MHKHFYKTKHGKFSYERKETSQWGLLWVPTVSRKHHHPLHDFKDKPFTRPCRGRELGNPWWDDPVYGHFQRGVREEFERIFNLAAPTARSIIEIGVDAPRGWHKLVKGRDIKIPQQAKDRTSTSLLLAGKRKETLYVGVDLEDKSYLNNPAQNIYTVRSDSRKITKICKKLQTLGINKGEVDFIYIDGYHSIDTVFQEWYYVVEYLSPMGIALFHDTNYHPGPALLMEAINPEIFDVKKYFVDEYNWGLAEVKYK